MHRCLAVIGVETHQQLKCCQYLLILGIMTTYYLRYSATRLCLLAWRTFGEITWVCGLLQSTVGIPFIHVKMHAHTTYPE